MQRTDWHLYMFERPGLNNIKTEINARQRRFNKTKQTNKKICITCYSFTFKSD